MNSFTREEMDWAAGLAGQLRLVQADCADVAPAERVTYLEEAIQRGLREIVAEKRPAYLHALASRFPTGETSSVLPPAQGGSINENSPEALVDRLVFLAGTLPKRKLLDLGVKLQHAGFIEVQTTTLVDQPPAEFTQRFPVEAGQAIDLQRLFKLTTTLADFVFGMDKVVWNIWKAIAPKSKIRKDVSTGGDLKSLGARYLGGDQEVGIVQINQLVDRLRQLLAGILTAIGPAGRGYSRQHLARFSPDAIKDLASAESGMFVGIEQKCWRKYVELSAELSEDGIEAELQESIARYAEDLIRGTSRTPDA